MHFYSNQKKGLSQQTSYQISKSPSGNVYLANEQRKKWIGRIRDNSFHCMRNPDKHLHRKSNAYGFSYELIKWGTFKFVIVHLPDSKLLITTREQVLRKGFILEFRGFEKQIFMRISDFGLQETDNKVTTAQLGLL